MALLSARGITVRFGGVVALDDVSLDVEEGEIVGLAGPGGAGKTTLLDVVSRLVPPDRGALELRGRSLLSTPPSRVARRGVARTFQTVELFGSMTVLDHVLVGAHARARPFAARTALKRASGVIDYCGRAAVADSRVAGLPAATRRRIELARAVAGDPSLLLLDDPAGGLDPAEADELGALVARLRADLGLAVLVAGRHVRDLRGLADRVHVLDFGRTLAQGDPEQLRHTREVTAAYLGAGGAPE